jgi:sugar lactone lactonase YvrE
MIHKLIPACRSSVLWNGLAITSLGRIFVWFNQSSRKDHLHIAEVMLQQQILPYPNESWNKVDESRDLLYSFICIQSIRIGNKENLWVLDKGCFEEGCLVKDSAKIIEIDLQSNKVKSIIPLNEVLTLKSEIKDMRVYNNYIFLTDIGEEALILMSIENGKGHRFNKHTVASYMTKTVIADNHLSLPGEAVANGGQLELSPNGNFLLYVDSSGNIRRYSTEQLLQQLPPVQDYFILKHAIQANGPLTTDPSGNIYIIDNIQSRIVRVDTAGESITLIEDYILRDADSLWVDDTNFLWITLGKKGAGSGSHKADSLHFPVYLMKLSN